MSTEFNPGGAASLNAAVKARYEANPDTNPFDDLAATKLASIGSGNDLLMTSAERERLTKAILSDPGTTGGTAITNIVTILRANYNSVVQKNETTLYVIRDEGTIYLGSSLLYDTDPLVAPVAAGGIVDRNYQTGSGDQIVDAAVDFTGQYIVYSVSSSVPGVTINASSGILTIPTGTSTSGNITVTGTNGAGSAQSQFSVTIADGAALTIGGNSEGTVDIVMDDGTFSVTVSGSDYAHQNGTFGPFDTADLDSGPVLVVAPVISGSAVQGSTLTAEPGLWVHEAADGTTTVTAIWQADGVDISGETGTTYDTVGGDVGALITYEEEATNSAGTRTSDSNGITVSAAATAPAQMAAPAVTATSATEISVDRAAAPSDGGSAILSYDLRYEVDGSGSWTTVTGITDPQTVTGLTASTLYNVQTRAVNAVGPCPTWSASGSATTNATSGLNFNDDFSTYTVGANLENEGPYTRVASFWDSTAKIADRSGTAVVVSELTQADMTYRYNGATAGADRKLTVDLRDVTDLVGGYAAFYLSYVDASNYIMTQIGSDGYLFIQQKIGGTATVSHNHNVGAGTTKIEIILNGGNLSVYRNSTLVRDVGSITTTPLDNPGFRIREAAARTKYTEISRFHIEEL